MPTARTAVIYARFSCNKQREASIDDQLRICRQWCQRERYAIVAEYCDYAISGRTDDRPEFQRMVANAGESDIVLVYMMDRFSRGEYDAPIYKRELAQHGVKLVSALEQIPDSPEGIIYEKLLEGLAACESKKTAIRTRRGMEGNALKCKTNGVRVFGYASNEADEYVINEDEAAFVREAFKRRIAKETTNSIARDFAARGVKTSQGNPCGYSMVERMVKNRKYTGRYEWGGVVKEGGMPAIIDEVTFMEAQGIRAAKERSAESWGDFALSGKAICAGCGRNLQGVSGRGRKNVKYEYYRCHDGCVRPVRREELEGGIVEALRALLQDREEALRIAHMVAESSDGAEVAARRKQAAQSLSAAERGLKNILNAIEQGIIAPGAKERIAELEHQRDRAKLDLEAIRDDQIDPERLADFLQCGSALDDATLLKAFVYQVSVSDEECIVTLNYDVESNEPARLDVQRVRTKCKWCPFLARSSRGVSSDGDLRGFSDTWRAHLAKASPFSDAWRANLAANWRFSCPRPLSGCMERKICHGLPPGNAFREYFAIGKRPGTHRGGILSRQGPRERTAREYCHCQPGQERIRAQSCHRRTLRNASCEHFAIVERPGTHIRNVLPTERHLRAGGPIALP